MIGEIVSGIIWLAVAGLLTIVGCLLFFLLYKRLLMWFFKKASQANEKGE